MVEKISSRGRKTVHKRPAFLPYTTYTPTLCKKKGVLWKTTTEYWYKVNCAACKKYQLPEKVPFAK